MSEGIDLLQGDCLDKMGGIADGSVDMVLCDLPYGTTYADFDTVLKNGNQMRNESVIDLGSLWNHYRRIIKPDGAIVLFGAQPFTSVLVASNLAMYKYTWVWEKNKAANHVAVKFQPLKVHEDIVVFSHAGVNTGASTPLRYNPQGVCWEKKKRFRKNDIRKEGTFRYNALKAGEYEVAGTNYPISILSYDVPFGKERIFPTQKPVPLLEYLIKTYTSEGEVVLDNCMGSGSTGVACINTGRNFIGIEKNKEYFELAKARIMNHEREVSGNG
jgi:site-specific DNA-methyltransferase (adenine-specific)